MPRNAQGLYTLPAGNPVVPNTLIETSWANPTMSDIADALTASLPRDGSAPMTGPLTLQAAAPTQSRHAVSKGYMEQFLAYATGMPIGSLLPVAGATIPSGFLLCNGQAVSRTTYPDLFATIGTIYGSGDGSTTFNVPDMRDWFIRGRADARAIGSQQAAAFASHLHAVSDPGHAHVGSQAGHAHGVTVAAHGHTVNDPGHTHSANATLADSGSAFYSHNSAAPASTVNTNVAATGITINNAPQLTGSTDAQQPAVTVAPDITGVTVGATGGDETRPQNIAMNYVIKAVNDSAQTVNITGITSSDENVVGISTTNPTVPELVIKTNVAFGGVKLDASGKVPLQQMPFENSSLLGFFDASGGQNPSQKYPAVTFKTGDEFIVSVAGTINVFDPVTETSAPTLVAVGSTLLYIAGSVSSPTGWYTVVAAAATNASAVSFLPEGTISATDVQAAINELDTETQTALGGKAPSSAATATGTSFSPSGNILATNVQAAIQELDAEKVPYSYFTAAGVPFTPYGSIGATNVQAAIQELDAETQTGLATKVSKSGDTMSGALNWSNNGANWEAGTTKNFRLKCETQPGEAVSTLMTRIGLYHQPSLAWAGASIDFLRGSAANDGQVTIRGSSGANASTISVGNGGMALMTTGTIQHTAPMTIFNGGARLAFSSGTTTKVSNALYFNSQDTEGYIRGSITPGVSAEIELNPGASGGSFQLKSTGVGVAPVSWSPASDVRLKDNITPIPDALNKLDRISGNTYNRNDLGGMKMVGVIAQEVQAVLPEGVSVFREDFLAVDPMAVTALLVEAVKQLKAEVDDLRAQLAFRP